jgi:hypothetical protein
MLCVKTVLTLMVSIVTITKGNGCVSNEQHRKHQSFATSIRMVVTDVCVRPDAWHAFQFYNARPSLDTGRTEPPQICLNNGGGGALQCPASLAGALFTYALLQAQNMT